MHRWLTVTAVALALVIGGVALGGAQEGTPSATSAQGGVCASPEALVIASPGLTMIATPEIEIEGTPGTEPGATPGALDETRIDDPDCPPDGGTPTP